MAYVEMQLVCPEAVLDTYFCF